MPQPAQERSYEQLVQDLEVCVKDLEEGRLPLEKAIERFKEGIALVKVAEERLQQAEGQVNLLLRGEDGADQKVPLQTPGSTEAPRGARVNTSAPAAATTPVTRATADEDIPF